MSASAKVIELLQRPVKEWRAEGLRLGERERSARSLMWNIGDWWNRGEAYGERVQIITAPDWTGPTHETCRVAGSIANRWNPLIRINGLSFKHHRLVAALPDVEALPLLQWCLETVPETGEPRPTQELKTRIKQVRREQREAELGEATRAAAANTGTKIYNVGYADPPWRFEPHSRVTGLDRAADNHYPTEHVDQIRQMARPQFADDAVMFMWATVPMLGEALSVLDAWGFEYKSHFVWTKDRAGTGHWSRNQHELLLIGTRGNIPAPAPGEQYPSVISAPLGEHSEKPAAFAEMIEDMFPNLPAVELFARAPRLGWDVWGNEAAA